MPTNPPFPAVTIKSNFQTGDKPTQAQFEQFIDGVAEIDNNSPLNNFAATTNPTVNDDANDGYSVGSWWINVTADTSYQCVDSTIGAAIWQLSSSSSLPSQIGQAGKALTTNGSAASWSEVGTAGLANSSVTSDKIANASVTFTKIQDVNTSTLLGRSTAGTGDVESLTVSGALSIAAGVLSAPTTNQMTTKGSVVAADQFAIADSAAGNANAKITLTTLLAAISLPGRFLSMQAFTANGTYTTPGGVNSILVYCAGGGAGAYNVGGNTNGGTTSFGAACSATGGALTGSPINSTSSSNNSSVSSPGTGTGGNINISGGGGAGSANVGWNFLGGSAWQLTGNGANGGLAIKIISSPNATYTVTIGVSGGSGASAGYIYVLEYA